MRRPGTTPTLATAIAPCPSVAPSAIAVGRGSMCAPIVRDEVNLAQIVLAEAATARRAGRWLHGVNYLNLGLCVVLILEVLESQSPLFLASPQAVLELALWFVLDFLPVTLVFAGAQRLKHLKSFWLVAASHGGILYLAAQRGLMACGLFALAPLVEFRSIPTAPLALAFAVIAAVNFMTALLVLRLLARPAFRRAFR